MPAPRAYSPSFVSVADAADQALARENGMDIYFTVERYGSLEACLTLSRSFQKSFTSLRARARRLSERRIGEEGINAPRDSMAVGNYDTLVCQRVQMGEGRGWIVSLIPTHVVMSQFDCRDPVTGEKITDLGFNADRETVLFKKAMRKPIVLTVKEWDEFTALKPGWHTHLGDIWFPRYIAVGAPPYTPEAPTHRALHAKPKASSLTLADLDAAEAEVRPAIPLYTPEEEEWMNGEDVFGGVDTSSEEE